MFRTRNRFYLHRSYPTASLGLVWYVEDVVQKTYSIVSNLIMEPAEDGLLSAPVTYISYEDAQQLMDELWNCGVRPTEGAGTAGSMAATEKHLEDMRKIVFDHYLKNA